MTTDPTGLTIEPNDYAHVMFALLEHRMLREIDEAAPTVRPDDLPRLREALARAHDADTEPVSRRDDRHDDDYSEAATATRAASLGRILTSL